MYQLPGLNKAAFDKADRSPDADFYCEPRFVVHVDNGAIAAVTAVYAQILPQGGAILDLMSSWVSHLPGGAEYKSVVGHGMNVRELAANERLSRWFVQDLNENPVLPLETATFDAACLCVSVQYLQRPVEVFREVARVLRPGSPFVVTFSNRCFPTKAVANLAGARRSGPTDPGRQVHEGGGVRGAFGAGMDAAERGSALGGQWQGASGGGVSSIVAR
jgi:SAM-dependent methyltransferase